MKNKIILFAVALVTLGTGCKKLKSIANVTFAVPYSQEALMPTIPGYPSGFPLPPGGATIPLPTTPVITNYQQYLDQYHTSSKNIISVHLSDLGLDILTPASQNFNFLDSVELWVSANNQNPILAAYDYNITPGSRSLKLTTTSDDLKSYFLADTMYFKLKAHVNAIPDSGTNIKISSSFQLVANPIE